MKKTSIFLLVTLIITANLVYAKGVYQNYEEIEDIQKGETATPLGVIVKSFISGFKQLLSNIFLFDKKSIPVNNDTILNDKLKSKGTILHFVMLNGTSREINLADKKANLTLLDPVTWSGAIFEFNGKILKLGTGATAYEDGFLLMKKGNRKVNNTIEAIIEIVYVGEDSQNCSHIKCFEGNLHWFYCNGTNFGIIQECDECVESECMPKGYLTRIIAQDPQIVKENMLKERMEIGEKIDCTYINGTGYGTECAD